VLCNGLKFEDLKAFLIIYFSWNNFFSTSIFLVLDKELGTSSVIYNLEKSLF
jgi:hypothetical protein